MVRVGCGSRSPNGLWPEPKSLACRARVSARLERRAWKYAVALGVVGAVVGYGVPRILGGGSQLVEEAIHSNAPLTVTVRHPGEYQSLSFFTPM